MCYCRCVYEDHMGHCRKGPEEECPAEAAEKAAVEKETKIEKEQAL